MEQDAKKKEKKREIPLDSIGTVWDTGGMKTTYQVHNGDYVCARGNRAHIVAWLCRRHLDGEAMVESLHGRGDGMPYDVQQSTGAVYHVERVRSRTPIAE